jgi:hypothetical protein
MSNKKDSESGNWNWEENDKEFYQKFLRLPESKNKKYYQAMKEHRFKFGTTKNKIDLRPRTFLSVMKVEIILLIFGVGFAISIENNKIFVYFITCSPPILFPTSSCKTKRTR